MLTNQEGSHHLTHLTPCKAKSTKDKSLSEICSPLGLAAKPHGVGPILTPIATPASAILQLSVLREAARWSTETMFFKEPE